MPTSTMRRLTDKEVATLGMALTMLVNDTAKEAVDITNLLAASTGAARKGLEEFLAINGRQQQAAKRLLADIEVADSVFLDPV